MFCSGKYVRDRTAGIADIKDLPPPEGRPWSFSIMPYFWAAGLDGKLRVSESASGSA